MLPKGDKVMKEMEERILRRVSEIEEMKEKK